MRPPPMISTRRTGSARLLKSFNVAETWSSSLMK